MLRIRRIEIRNFACFDDVVIEPSTRSEKPLTVIRAENGSGKTTLLRAIRWGMYGEKGLPGNASQFSLHPAGWKPDVGGIQTEVSIEFETDGSSRDHPDGSELTTAYLLRRTVRTIARDPAQVGESDFTRIDAEAQLLMEEAGGQWKPHEAGVDRVIGELLPWDLRDFFVMDADEAADYVGGSENKVIQRQEVIEKTSFAVRSLLGLKVFKDATDRVRTIGADFGRAATKAVGSRELTEQQTELDQLKERANALEKDIESGQREKADIEDALGRKRADLETLAGNIGAHEQLGKRLKEVRERRKTVDKRRQETFAALAGELGAIDLLSSMAAREIDQVREVLQPLYEDGSIPIAHLGFVQGLLEKGVCVCGQDLVTDNVHREHVQEVITQSRDRESRANYLADVLHGADALHQHKDVSAWQGRCGERGTALAQLDAETKELADEQRDIDDKLKDVDDQGEAQVIRDHISMLDTRLQQINRDLGVNQHSIDGMKTRINELEGIIRHLRGRQSEARDHEACQETAAVVVQILEQAYANIRDEQVQQLSEEMNRLFAMMAANVDDEFVEGERHKASLRMIAEVGLRPLDGGEGQFEIFALNGRRRSMPPTEINGASRRILGLSFVLALCNVSRTFAPFVADSLLNFMSGSVRTNTLRVTADTASQPILLLTGSDLESQQEVELVTRYAGATYTLTGQWQHVRLGGDVVNQTDERKVSLVCQCGPREYCGVCERQGQAGRPGWSRQEQRSDLQWVS